VTTYGDIAREAGLPGRARLVGRVLRGLPQGSRLPWHRVLRSDGRPGLQRASAAGREQLRRLHGEGVRATRDGRIDLTRFRWRP
jgi:methylated-DNA-protein-cysteine methyltransferase-like protein